MEVLANASQVTLLQYIDVSYQHIVYLKLSPCYVLILA